MADKGIIFSAAMVNALLAGRKTQTRRLLADAPEGNWHCDRGAVGLRWVAEGGSPSMPCRVPYAIGDRLYVREAWSGIFWDPEDIDGPARELWATPKVERTADLCSGRFYRVDEESKPFGERFVPESQWQPSIHMPRWAARLWLLVTDVRVQRVSAVSEDDAAAEGVQLGPPGSRPDWGWIGAEGLPDRQYASEAFRDLWDSLHAKPGERWEDNPWVVAVTFAVNRGNIDGGPHG